MRLRGAIASRRSILLALEATTLVRQTLRDRRVSQPHAIMAELEPGLIGQAGESKGRRVLVLGPSLSVEVSALVAPLTGTLRDSGPAAPRPWLGEERTAPNRLGVSVCRVDWIDGFRLGIEGLNAVEGSPVSGRIEDVESVATGERLILCYFVAASF